MMQDYAEYLELIGVCERRLVWTSLKKYVQITKLDLSRAMQGMECFVYKLVETPILDVTGT